MKSDKKCNKFYVMGIAFAVLLFGSIIASSQNEKAISSEANPDLIVVVNEDYLNRVIKADLEERSLPGVKEVTVDLNENKPIEVNAALKIGVGPLAVERNVGVEANISIENDTLKVEPKVLKVGFLNLPEDTWIGPIKSAMQAVEVAANNAYQDALAKGYRVTDVYTGNNTLTLSVMAPDKPF